MLCFSKKNPKNLDTNYNDLPRQIVLSDEMIINYSKDNGYIKTTKNISDLDNYKSILTKITKEYEVITKELEKNTIKYNEENIKYDKIVLSLLKQEILIELKKGILADELIKFEKISNKINNNNY